jgi:hypothetical protein
LTCFSRAAGAGQYSPKYTIHAPLAIRKKSKVYKRFTVKKAASDVKNIPEFQKSSRKKLRLKKVQKLKLKKDPKKKGKRNFSFH